MPSGEPVNAYCPTHDLFGCPFCHGERPGVVAMDQVASYPPEFVNVVQALDAAHYPPDDPIHRVISGFDFPNILDEGEAGC